MRRVSWALTRRWSTSRGVGQRVLDGGAGDLVEDQALDRAFRIQDLDQVPGDRLAFSVLVGGEVAVGPLP